MDNRNLVLEKLGAFSLHKIISVKLRLKLLHFSATTTHVLPLLVILFQIKEVTNLQVAIHVEGFSFYASDLSMCNK